MKALKYVSIISLFFFSTNLFAQDQPLYNQYLLNNYMVNPAACGAEGYTSFDMTHRQQWLTFPGAPFTSAISAQSRLLKSGVVKGSTGKSSYKGSRSGRVGIGGYLYNDQNGAIAKTGLQLTYAYHIYLGGTQVSFGITGAAYQKRVDKAELLIGDPSFQDDPAFAELQNYVIPDANIGVFVMNNNLYGGISSTQLFKLNFLYDEYAYTNDSTNENVSTPFYDAHTLFRNYYFHGGYRLYVNQGLYFEPSFFARLNGGRKVIEDDPDLKHIVTLESDFSLKTVVNEMYWIGYAYRTRGTSVLYAGVKVARYYFTYAFEFATGSDIRSFNSGGSHEVMIALKLGDSARRYRYLDRY